MRRSSTNLVYRTLAVASLGILPLSGCNCGHSFEGQFATTLVTKRFASSTINNALVTYFPTNILFIIDDSGSMKSSQENLMAAFDAAAGIFFKGEGEDVCIAVGTSSDYTANPTIDPTGIDSFRPFYSPICTLDDNGNPIDPNSLIPQFKAMVDVGTGGTGLEWLPGSLLEMIKVNETPGSPSRLFRPGSRNFVVTLTDEEWQSCRHIPGSNDFDMPGLNPDLDKPKNAVKDFYRRPWKDGGLTGEASCEFSFQGESYELDRCVNTEPGAEESKETCVMMTPSDVREKLDNFFRDLDGYGPSETPENYSFVAVGIHEMLTLLSARISGKVDYSEAEDQCSDWMIWGACEQNRREYAAGLEYEEMVSLVGNGSFYSDLADDNYFDSFLGEILEGSVEISVEFDLVYPPEPGSVEVSLQTDGGFGQNYILENGEDYEVEGATLKLLASAVHLIESLSSDTEIKVTFFPTNLEED